MTTTASSAHNEAQRPHRFPLHGWAGIAMIVGMETALAAHVFGWLDRPWWLITMYATPVFWWGYILLLDAWIHRRTGRSWILHRRRIFLLQIILSVAFWVLFEGYNVLMNNWTYTNLPADYRVRYTGYILSFATIMPGMFLTAEFLQTFSCCARFQRASAFRVRVPRRPAVWIGAAFCIIPPLLPASASLYLFGFVWLGYILWLDPINEARGARSLFADWERGRWATTVSLLAAGAVCGLLWEFWNFWAHTKWEYTFPILKSIKLFEMPVAGFLGFPPFALEYFVLYHFIASFFTAEDTLGL